MERVGQDHGMTVAVGKPMSRALASASSASNVIIQTAKSLIQCSACMLSTADIDDSQSDSVWVDHVDHRLLENPVASFPVGHVLSCNGSVLQGIILRRENRVWSLTMMREEHDVPFSENDAETVRKLRDTFAMLLSQQPDQQDQQVANIGWAVLDRMRSGIVLLDKNATVVATNARARHVLNEDYGVALVGAKLRFDSANDRAKFSESLHATLNTPGQSVHAITLEPEPNRSLQIRFFRLTLGGRTDGQQRYLAGAVMFDPHRDTQPSQQIIQELYGLTNVEAEVVIALSGGLSISEASDKLHISIFTARGYLKSIFRKTGACRQSDLVRLATAASGIE